ncbi:MAG: SDR family NAD(P)-dependent oxidoreductase [Deltaproteobacteria bacterium]
MKRVIITGCSRGIGLAITKKFLKNGFEVLGTYRTTNSDLRELSNDPAFKSVVLHLDDPDSVESFIKECVNPFNPTVLVNNAAMAQRKPFLEISHQDWLTMFQTNFVSMARLCQAVLPFMIKQKEGRIVNLSSLGGQWGGVHQVHYAAAKAAVINLTKSLAKTFSNQNIAINCVSPGVVETQMIEGELPQDSKSLQDFLNRIPMSRLGRPEEIADLVAFLVSDNSGYITGQTIGINGGLYFS